MRIRPRLALRSSIQRTQLLDAKYNHQMTPEPLPILKLSSALLIYGQYNLTRDERIG